MLTVQSQPRYLLARMTAAEIYESVTNGGATNFRGSCRRTKPQQAMASHRRAGGELLC